MNRKIFEQLLKVVEGQLIAARKLDGVALTRLTRERASLQEQISLSSVVALTPADRSFAKQTLLKIRELDRRIKTCAQLVIDSISTIVPAASPVVYNARGYIRGG
jgi:hypothetical protein